MTRRARDLVYEFGAEAETAPVPHIHIGRQCDSACWCTRTECFFVEETTTDETSPEYYELEEVPKPVVENPEKEN